MLVYAMKILKDLGKHLRRKSRQYLILHILCAIGIVCLINSGIRKSQLYIPLYDYESIRGVLLFPLLVFGVQFLRKYEDYKKGLQGEKQVIEQLRSLNDQYSLINDIKFPNNYGNIDHIVLAPNGIFVLETKNHSGKIVCNGDEWSQQYKKTVLRRNPRPVPYRFSPSVQVRMNAMRIKEVIDSLDKFKSLRIWVQGVVVFTNKDVELEIITRPLNVDILLINDLANYLIKTESKHLTSQEINMIANEIIKQA